MSAPARIRRDPRDPASMRARAPAAVFQPETVVRVDEAAPFVLAVLDLDAGRLSRDDRDLMGAARRLADDLGGGVMAAACLPPAGEFSAKLQHEGADRVALLRDPAFAEEMAEPRLSSILAAAEACTARHILFSDTAVGSELARRIAARLGDRAAFDVRRLAPDGLVADIDAGRTEVRRELPRVIVLARSMFGPLDSAPVREARVRDVPPAAAKPRVRDRGLLPLDPASVPLNEADLIIGAGSGLTDWGSFHAAARVLGAAEAGSRVVCDAGLLPRSRQVGASGLLVEPRCYLAFGIAGASQHLQGIAGAQRVIAVNTDLRAEMVQRADLAIVADAQAVLPALVRRAALRRLETLARPSFPSQARRTASELRTQAQVDVIALASLGKHPVSQCARKADLDGRALELALGCASAVTALHAGRADAPALRDYLGAGATNLVVLGCAAEADPLPALAAWLRAARPALIVAGARAEAGECSGMVPHCLAEWLGYGLATNIVAVNLVGEAAHLVQALPGGKRRALEATLPLVITVGRTGPEPRLSARMRAMRGPLDVRPSDANPPDNRTLWSTKPSRPRPKRLAAPLAAGTGADTGRREMLGPAPDAAADAILDFLERDGLLMSNSATEAPS